MVKAHKISCPYSDKHKMRYTRLIYHLAKGCPERNECDFEVCLYNWVHRIPKGGLEDHYKVCESKPKDMEEHWNKDINMEIWTSGNWNSVLYQPNWPPEFFPDY